MQDATLVRMVNQIAAFFAGVGGEEGVTGAAGHIRNVWDPRMRRALYAYVARGGEGLDPLAAAAVERLRESDPAAHAA
jgi:formate dehydrogenase subunit delta